MTSKIEGMVVSETKRGGRTNMLNNNVQEWEVRPGGMMVQKRNSVDSNQNSVPVPMIRVRVKYGSFYHEISINSQASFGELKKMLAEKTGLHHEDQKLLYKKKERDSKSFLDVARVKNGSKLVLIEDVISHERRCLEMIKSANIEKASKLLKEISLEVDKLSEKVRDMKSKASQGGKVAELDVENLTEMLMRKLVALDGIVVNGDLKLQKTAQEKRVQKHIETVDILKLQNSKAGNDGRKTLQKQQNPEQKVATETKNHPVEQKQRIVTKAKQQEPSRKSETIVFSTKWETFD